MDRKMVYVFCPNDFVTGGPDALHQMVYYLNLVGIDAEIVYYAYSNKHVFSIPNAYKKYISKFVIEKDFVDDENCTVVVPEHAVGKLKLFKKSKVFIWWLSVDNNTSRSSFFWKIFFFATLPARVVKNWAYYKKHFGEAVVKTLQAKVYSFKKESDNVAHICASYYAYDFVSKKSSNKVSLCIEPISKFFLEKYNSHKDNLNSSDRKNVVLYNPRKSGVFVKKLADYAPDLNFEPLVGLTQEQLIDKYKSSKVYVDFGPFPGAERIPKEAVLFGCSIVTGRRGASNFYGDVPILDEYKFGDYQNQIEQIVQKIRELLSNYNTKNKDFFEYRKSVLSLEENFMKSLKDNVL